MTTKDIWSNMAVADVERTTKFYTELGFKSNGNPVKELTSFLAGANNFVMHFFLKDQLEIGNKGPLADLKNGNEVIFTIGAESKTEVDNWAAKVSAAGGTLVSQPEEFGEGYYGFVFADPDGHRFNVFFM